MRGEIGDHGLSSAATTVRLPAQRAEERALPGRPDSHDPIELLIDVAQLVARSLDLDETLQAVARAVVASLGFGAAVVNLVRPEGVVVAAMEGPVEMQAALTGDVQPLEQWQRLLDMSRPLGSLRFIDGRAQADMGDVLTWIPDLPISDDADSWHPLDALFAPLYGSDGQLIGVLSVDLPVDGRRPGAEQVGLMERFARQAELAMDRARMHQELAESEELFRRSFESTPLGMALVAADGSLLRVNAAFAALAGRTVEELVGQSLYDIGPETNAVITRRTLWALTEGSARELSGDLRLGERRWLRAHASRVDGRHGTQVLLHLEDVTEMQQSREALRRRASTDALTGALNRDAFHRSLTGLTQRSGEAPTIGLLFVDLDLFKLVNDSHGHRAGDQVLETITARMREALRSGDLLCRFGGDEFVVGLPAVSGPAHAIEVADRLLRVINEPLDLGGHRLHPTVSIGITVGAMSSEADIERLLGEADAALYRAKLGGRGRWEVFQTWMSECDQAQLGLRSRLRRALDEDEFRLHYQPVVDMASERIVGYEALIRWQHPDRGLLTPADFLTELFEGELAAAATDWVIERAVADAASWQATPEAPSPWVSINVAPQQFTRPDFAERLLSCLGRHRLQPERLLVELLEQSLPTGDLALRQMQTLREGGVGIAIDDLGSGYSGLLTLRRVPATIVKLDMDFARSIHEPTTAAIVRAVVELTRALGIRLVAEGIEERDSARRMAEIGVDYGQGYLFGAPAELQAATPYPVRAPQPGLSADFSSERRKLAAALSLAGDPEQVAQVAIQAARRVAGTAAGHLVQLDRERRQLRTVYTRGIDQDVVERFPSFGLDSSLPLSVAVRTGETVLWSPSETRRQMAPFLDGKEYDVSVAALPLLVRQPDGSIGPWGGLCVMWPDLVEIGKPVAAYVRDLADQVAARLGDIGA